MVEQEGYKMNQHRVSCGECGAVLLHDLARGTDKTTKQPTYECYLCGFTDDPCSFPDYEPPNKPPLEEL